MVCRTYNDSVFAGVGATFGGDGIGRRRWFAFSHRSAYGLLTCACPNESATGHHLVSLRESILFLSAALPSRLFRSGEPVFWAGGNTKRRLAGQPVHVSK